MADFVTNNKLGAKFNELLDEYGYKKLEDITVADYGTIANRLKKEVKK